MNKLRLSLVVALACWSLLINPCWSSYGCTMTPEGSREFHLLYNRMTSYRICPPSSHYHLPQFPDMEHLNDSELAVAALEITSQVSKFIHLYHRQLHYKKEARKKMMGLLHDRYQSLSTCVQGDTYMDHPVIQQTADYFNQLGNLVKTRNYRCVIQDEISTCLRRLSHLNSRMRAAKI